MECKSTAMYGQHLNKFHICLSAAFGGRQCGRHLAQCRRRDPRRVDWESWGSKQQLSGKRNAPFSEADLQLTSCWTREQGTMLWLLLLNIEMPFVFSQRYEGNSQLYKSNE